MITLNHNQVMNMIEQSKYTSSIENLNKLHKKALKLLLKTAKNKGFTNIKMYL